jgi:hypothetical protein
MAWGIAALHRAIFGLMIAAVIATAVTFAVLWRLAGSVGPMRIANSGLAKLA